MHLMLGYKEKKIDIIFVFMKKIIVIVGAGETGSMYVASYKVRSYIHITLWSVQSVQR